MNKKYFLSAMAVSAVIFLGFQNCSKVGVTDIASTTSQKASFEQVLDEEAKEAMEEPAVVDGPVAEVPKNEMPPAPRPNADDEDPVVEEPTEEEVALLCIKAKDNGKSELHRKKLLEVVAGAISNIRGHHVVESDLINLIENVRGKLIVKAKTDGGVIKSIVDTRGALIICGMDVESIDNTRGHIVLVNSRVQSLSNHRGNVKLLGSQVLKTVDVKGNIKEIQAK